MTEERVQFGARLRVQREARALTVSDIVKLTKIPERSVISLEAGRFEELPAEVFVRGFLSSYGRIVGLEVAELLATYEGLVKKDRPRTVPSLARLGTAPAREREPERVVEPEDNAIFSALSEAGKGTGRMGLTLAVIILVIVATLTLSLLLRRPSHVGDGVSWHTLSGAKVG